MHEERSGSEQPPEYQSAWSASSDSADDHVTSSGADADRALHADALRSPDEHAAQATAPDAAAAAGTEAGTGTRQPWDPPGEHEPGEHEPGADGPGADGPAADGYPHPTMIYAPPGTYVSSDADETAAGPGYGSPAGSYGAGGGYGGGPGYPGGYGSGEYGPGGPYPPGGAGYGMPGDIIGGGYGQERPPRRGSRILTYVVVAALAAGVGAGTVLALNHNSGSSSATPNVTLPGTGAIPTPGSGLGSGGGNTNANSSVTHAVAQKVSPGIVDVISQPAYQSGTLEGTGMILSSNGLVLTNNHVVEGTSSIRAKIANTGRTYTVTVLGTDAGDDVALLKLNGASGLTPVPLGNSQRVQIGDAVVALGNAGGQDSVPAVVSGKITNLNQSIKASDQGAGTTENLHGMLQTSAPIVSGDSGGALANTSGQVIGMNTAANSSPGVGGGQASSVGFAIPINRALAIADQIAGGHASAKIQIGLPAFLGVTVARAANGTGSSTATSPQVQLQQLQQAAQAPNGFGGFGGGQGGNGSGACLPTNDSLSVPSHIAPVGTGALISGVLCSTPVASAGMTAGSVITSINGQAITSPAALTKRLTQFHPGNTISVTWVAPSGQQHTSSLALAPGPAK
jgi:S1-C subfamily serine protease